MMNESKTEIGAELSRFKKLGVKASLLNRSEVQSLFPHLNTCGSPFDLSGEVEHVCKEHKTFLYENEGGYADPLAANNDFIRAAQERGVMLQLNSRVASIDTVAGKVSSVKTVQGQEYFSPAVVNAAGPWCNELNKIAGITTKWKLDPTRIQVCVHDLPPAAHRKIPVFAETASGIYGRPEARGSQVLFGSIMPSDEEETIINPDQLNTSVDPDFRDSKLHALHHRIHGCQGRGNATGIAGLYTINRDDMHPILGESELGGYFLANGFSGHGFKFSPSVGSMMGQLITGEIIAGDSQVDPHFFSLNREALKLKVKSALA